MPLALALVLALTLSPQISAPDSPEETVRVLVPDDSAIAASSTTSPEMNPTGLVPVDVPVRGTVEETIGDLEMLTGQELTLDHRYQLYAPQDEPGFPDQWHHENTGQDGGLSDADIDSLTAWNVAQGEGVVVAVIDSGVELSHPDLVGRIHPSRWDFVDGDNDPNPVGSGPDEAHGTSVAGVIAASANGQGITGVAPEARIMAIRACSDGGCFTNAVANSVRFAADNGADIINLSLGSITTQDPVLEGAMVYARDRDVLVVTASGNDGDDLDELPAGLQLIPGGLPYSNIVNVAASDRRDRLAPFSNFGRTVVDIVAPGAEIITTATGGLFSSVSGTSFASPVVAGVAALLVSADPGTGHHELVARITSFVDRPGTLDGFSRSGRLNSGRALTRFFVDTSSSVFVDAIDWLAAANITNGCNPPTNIRFCPGDRVTRGEMAVFLARAFGLPDTGGDFFDDDEGAFYERAANRLLAAGLTVGCGTRRYCGEDDISRGEMAAMLARALSLPATGADRFSDDEDSIFEGAINKIAAVGITVGCNPPANTRYCPSNPVTRGEMAAFIKRSRELGG